MIESYLKQTYQFIKVTGEDGSFFDCVIKCNVKDHLKFLAEGAYETELVDYDDVPDCIYRLFKCERYCTEVKKGNGTDFYFRDDDEDDEY